MIILRILRSQSAISGKKNGMTHNDTNKKGGLNMSDEVKLSEVDQKKATDAKNLSKWGMVIAVIVQAISTIVYILVKKDFPALDTQISISYFAFSFMIPFTPVYLNLFLDKIFGGKK